MLTPEFPPSTGRQAGFTVVELLVALALGLGLGAAAASLHVALLSQLRSLLRLQLAHQDARGVEAFITDEWRRAGYRLAAGASAVHDTVTATGSAESLVVSYRHDLAGSDTSSGPQSVRLNQGVWQFRTSPRSGFQSLHDTASWQVLRAEWQAAGSSGKGCEEVLRLTVEARLGLEKASHRQSWAVRRRNHGVLTCHGSTP